VGGDRARYPTTLNGSALAIGRTLAALLEHGQRADGSVALPHALAPYLGQTELPAK
jgi:seryl-tRNA synthetase